MKKTLLFIIIHVLFFASSSFAQTKIDRFCEVSLDQKNSHKSKLVATISFGQVDSLFFFKDNSVIEKLKRVNALTTSTDVLNYMSNLGWTLVSVIPFGYATSHERFYFKKEFVRTDLGVGNQ